MSNPPSSRRLSNYDLLCFSHLRWNFVFQRPQHLLSRAAKSSRVFYVEEPICDAEETRLEVTRDAATGVHVCVPHLAAGLDWTDTAGVAPTLQPWARWGSSQLATQCCGSTLRQVRRKRSTSVGRIDARR